MPRFDRPYKISRCHPEKSTYTLEMPNSPNIFPTFRSSQLCAYLPNNSNLFPSCELERPDSITMEIGDDEWFVEKIVDEKWGQRGQEFLVKYRSYGDEENWWLPRRDVKELEALDTWLERTKMTKTVPQKSTQKSRTLAAAILDAVLDLFDTEAPTGPDLMEDHSSSEGG